MHIDMSHQSARTGSGYIHARQRQRLKVNQFTQDSCFYQVTEFLPKSTLLTQRLCQEYSWSISIRLKGETWISLQGHGDGHLEIGSLTGEAGFPTSLEYMCH